MALAVLVIAIACSRSETWPGLLDRMEQVDATYEAAITMADNQEEVFHMLGCSDFAEVAGAIVVDLFTTQLELRQDIQFAQHIADNDQDPRTLEYMSGKTEIETEYVSQLSDILSEMRIDAELVGCWPQGS